MKIAVVIPAYNEAKVIGEVIKEVQGITPHIFVVDDGSTDDTAEVARRGGATVLCHVINRGQGAGLRTGLEGALLFGADIIVTYDADGQMTATDIPYLTAPIEAGLCDVVLGSRFLSNNSGKIKNDLQMPFIRNLTLKLALVFTRATTGLKLTDTHNGLRAFSRTAVSKLNLHCDRMAHASEILEEISRLGLKHQETPVTIKYTEYSLKKGQKLSGAFKIIRDLLISSWVK